MSKEEYKKVWRVYAAAALQGLAANPEKVNEKKGNERGLSKAELCKEAAAIAERMVKEERKLDVKE